MSSTRAPVSVTRPTFDYDDDSDVEIIEDSEPEREERREQERIEKRRLQRAIPSSSGLGPTPKSTPSWLAPPTQPTQPTSSASSSVVSTKPPGDASQVLPTPLVTSSAPARQVAPPPWLVPKDTPAPDPPVRPASDNRQRTKSSSQPSPVKQLDINSFVFHKRTSGARYSASSRSVSSSKATDVEAPDPSKVVPAPSAKSSSSKTFHLGATNRPSGVDATFSSEQIASLTSCVVCGNSWTVRKQSKSKWSHITVCARKQGCGIESLHLKLVAAIVEAAEEQARKAAKGKEKADESATPQSLLAHTVQERAPPKRRGRRKAPGPSSLLSIEEAQKSILRQSTLLLGTGVSHQDENEPRPIALDQGPTSEDDHPEIPATQVFAPSKIGGRPKFFGSTTSMFNTDSASGLLYADEPQLLISGSRAGSPLCSPWDSRNGVYLWEDYVENDIEQPVSPTGLLADDLVTLTIQEPQGETAGTERYDRSQSSRGLSRSFQGQAVAMKDFDPPEKNIRSPPRPRYSHRPPSLKPSSKAHGKRSSSSDRPLSTAAPGKSKSKPKPKPKSTSPRPSKTKKRAKKNTIVYAPEDIQDDVEEPSTSKDIDAQLLAMITSDETLYLRILRYEPIKFEDLLGMAIARGIPKHGLQAKLKAFLDSQCINFYSGDNSGRRKRY
ncbi:hypothetical protein FS749_009352 [Ceratobasidium sp. UAMH 11750]|nr:hypothetical protein FS749_009352 [Ceratobasidium sp. UAMH 11750]